MSDAAHPDVSLEIDLDGVELKSVIVPQDFLPGGSSDWARFASPGLNGGKSLSSARWSASSIARRNAPPLLRADGGERRAPSSVFTDRLK